MTVFFVILSVLLWGGALWLLMSRRQMIAPALSFVAMVVLSLAERGGIPLLPISRAMLMGWLAMTIVVMIATWLQPEAVNAQTRGTGYMTLGALTGMVVGLLSVTLTHSVNVAYSLTIVATAFGTAIGDFLFTTTPSGRDVNVSSGRFFKYLLAKGFPIAITVMMLGMALVILISF